jgi:glycosyltransferase involved in cell wall biosynthesis
VRVTWITNLQAPYRTPVWRALAKLTDLEVWFLAAGADDRDWAWRPDPAYQSQVLTTRRLPGTRSDHALYVLPFGLPLDLVESDVVVLGGWEPPAYLQALAAALFRRKPIVLFYESTLASRRFGGAHPIALIRSLIVRNADVLLTAGVASTTAVLTMGARADRVVTGFNTIDVSRFRQAVETARKLPNVPSTGHVFLFVGRLIEVKNLPALLTAFRAIAKATDQLIVVGQGPLDARLQSTVAMWPTGLRQQVRFLGPQSGQALAAAYATANTLILPSVREVWGMVVNEALAAGLHVVVSERAGVADSIRSMQGVYVTGVSAQEIANAMAASRASWTGPIGQPEILSFTPESSARDALRACQLAVDLRHQITGEHARR